MLFRSEKAYLLTKVFASMILPVQELKLLTVEAVKKGFVELIHDLNEKKWTPRSYGSIPISP